MLSTVFCPKYSLMVAHLDKRKFYLAGLRLQGESDHKTRQLPELLDFDQTTYTYILTNAAPWHEYENSGTTRWRLKKYISEKIDMKHSTGHADIVTVCSRKILHE